MVDFRSSARECILLAKFSYNREFKAKNMHIRSNFRVTRKLERTFQRMPKFVCD